MPKFIQELDFVDVVLFVVMILLLTGLVPESIVPQATEWAGWLIAFLVGKKLPQSLNNKE